MCRRLQHTRSALILQRDFIENEVRSNTKNVTTGLAKQMTTSKKFNLLHKHLGKITLLVVLLSGGAYALFRGSFAREFNATDFANDQIRRMIRDRPAMQAYIMEHDLLWQWLVDQFSGKETGFLVEWSADMPDHNLFASSTIAYKESRAAIRVRPDMLWAQGKPAPGVLLWEAAIFELCNTQNSKSFGLLHEHALEGRVSKEMYVVSSLYIEWTSLQRSLMVYRDIWKPLMEARAIHIDPQEYNLWRPPLAQTFNAWVKFVKEVPRNAYEVHCKNYDATYAKYYRGTPLPPTYGRNKPKSN